MMRWGRWLASTFFMAAALDAAAQGLPSLPDVLDTAPYRASFDKMLKGQKLVDWVQTFVKTKSGIASPGESRMLGGSAYEEYDICKPNDCGGNFLFVIFAPGGRQAWALLIDDGRNVRYYGNPGAGVRQALDKAASLQR